MPDRMRRPSLTVTRAVMLAAAVAVISARDVPAQQIDAHFSYVPGDKDTHYPLVGGGVGVRLMVDAGALFVGSRLGVDYAREEHLGPGRGTVGLDLTLSPRREVSAFLPYAGVGLSLNVSGGKQPAWDGVRAGLDGIAGIDIATFGTDFLGLKLEERYGRITSLPATFATRIGIIVGF